MACIREIGIFLNQRRSFQSSSILPCPRFLPLDSAKSMFQSLFSLLLVYFLILTTSDTASRFSRKVDPDCSRQAAAVRDRKHTMRLHSRPRDIAGTPTGSEKAGCSANSILKRNFRPSSSVLRSLHKRKNDAVVRYREIIRRQSEQK